MNKDNKVQVIRKAAGADRCPAGKVALYTNINFNNGSGANETSDILIVPPDMQLDTKTLASYGFIVGDHDGVSSVVNKMNQPATLVSGTNLNGDTLRIDAGQNIASLVNYKRPSGATWNDATNSVVSAAVTKVNLTMRLETGISFEQGENYYALLQINNGSGTSITGATVDISSGNGRVFTVTTPITGVDIPANNGASIRIPLTGVNPGSAQLSCTLKTPLGIINSGENVSSTTVTVTEKLTKVNLTMTPETDISIPKGEYYDALLQIDNSSENSVTGATIEFKSNNTGVFTVTTPIIRVDIPANNIANVRVPLKGIDSGAATLTCTLVTPSGFVNNGDDVSSTSVKVTVTTVNLTMTPETGITIQKEENYYALLQIDNSSETAVPGATVDFKSDNEEVFTVTNPSKKIDIPANNGASVRVQLKGLDSGSATLTCTLKTPSSIANSGDNVSSTAVKVTTVRQLQVTVGTVGHWQDTWPSTEFIYSYPLTMSAASSQVKDWELSFLLPEGAALNKSWLESQSSWVTLNTEKSVNGNIYLDSQPGHVISPGTNINFSLQINYPEVSAEHEILDNLRLMQLS